MHSVKTKNIKKELRECIMKFQIVIKWIATVSISDLDDNVTIL